jgi:hypothetical protein
LGAVTSQHVEFMKRAWVAQVLNALSGEQFSFCLMTLDRSGAAGIAGLFLSLVEVVDFVLHGGTGGISHA